MSYDAMDARLQPIVAALAEVRDDELSALIATANSRPQIAPGLLAWIEHAAKWEQDRRAGSDFALQPPAAGDPSCRLDIALKRRPLTPDALGRSGTSDS
jgi:hypothetical protein